MPAIKRRQSVLGERVAAERRQRAIMAMLRDEQAEHTEELDERFRSLRDQGLIVPEPAKRARRTDESESGGDDQQKSGAGGTSSSNAYDEMYRDLQLQPSINNVHAASSVPIKQQQKSADTGNSQEVKVTLLGFDTALGEFFACCEEQGSTPAGIARLDQLLRIQLRPGLEKCPLAAPRHTLEQLVKMHSQFRKSKRDGRTKAPTFAQISFFRLLAALFPAAAQQARFHPILTPALAFGTELINGSRVQNIAHCARLIFLCHHLFELAGNDSSRPLLYLPEVMAFLRGALQLCCETRVDRGDRPEPFPTMSFPVSHPHRQMLHVGTKTISDLPRDAESGRLSLSCIFAETEDDEADNDAGTGDDIARLRLLTIRSLFDTIGHFASCYSHSPSAAQMGPAFSAIFGPFLQLFERLPVANYPDQLAMEANQLTEQLATLLSQHARVTHMHKSEKKGARALTMLEPRFDERFDPDRPQGGKANRAKAREQEWARRARKERRGALKVLRKDAREIAGAYADKQRKVRRERDEKTKRIMQTLEVQESEHKKLRAMKK